MRKTMRITNREKRYRAMTRRSNEGAQGVKGHPVRYALIITERNVARRRPIRSTTRYGREHAERICKQRTTPSYNYAMTVVA
jgi:hypothetical protein